MPLIKLENIEKTYDQNTENPFPALIDINLIIEPGDFLSIMGPSGSGKSTLMNIIGLLDVPDSGRYILNDIDITTASKSKLPKIRREQIGFIFQTFNLMPRLSVFENIRLPLIYSKFKRSKQKEWLMEILKTVNLSHRMNYRPTNLSGGEKQRVAIARALINSPSIILADEPTGNLDTKSGKEILEVLNKLNQQGKTIMLVTHDSDIDIYAHRHYRLIDGKLFERSRGEI